MQQRSFEIELKKTGGSHHDLGNPKVAEKIIKYFLKNLESKTNLNELDCRGQHGMGKNPELAELNISFTSPSENPVSFFFKTHFVIQDTPIKCNVLVLLVFSFKQSTCKDMWLYMTIINMNFALLTDIK